MLTKFEEYLREEHSKDYAGNDDNMGDDYEAWLTSLDNEELIEFGNKAMEVIIKDKNMTPTQYEVVNICECNIDDEDGEPPDDPDQTCYPEDNYTRD